MAQGETQPAPPEVKPADEVVAPPPAKQPRVRKAAAKKASGPVQPPRPTAAPVPAAKVEAEPEAEAPKPEPEAPKAEPVKKTAKPAAKAPKKAAKAPAEKAPAKTTKKAAKKAASAPAPVSTEPWVAPQGTFCPPSHPIKAKLSSRIFHLPGMFAYPRTAPDRCYAREEDAIEDGLTKAKR